LPQTLSQPFIHSAEGLAIWSVLNTFQNCPVRHYHESMA
jgi:hypothetical protein